MLFCSSFSLYCRGDSEGEKAQKRISVFLLEFMSQDKGRPLPKFGEWDVNDPASAEGFTVIFNKARDEKKTGGNTRGADSPGKEDGANKPGAYTSKPSNKKWFCCMRPSAAES